MGGKILVLGATGNIGRELIQLLRARRADVVAGVATPADATHSEQSGVRAAVANFSDPKALAAAMAGVERLFLLLPLVEPMGLWGADVVSAAKDAGVAYIVRSSGLGADADAEDYPLGRVHGLIDRAVMESGIDYAITRPCNFMQNFVNFYAEMLKAGTLYSAEGDGRVAFIDVRDIAAVDAELLLAPEAHRGRIYELTGPAALAEVDVVRLVGDARNRPIRYVPIDEAAAAQAMTQAGMPEWNIHMLLSLAARIRAGMASTVTTAVKDLTGREPNTFERFAREFADVWR